MEVLCSVNCATDGSSGSLDKERFPLGLDVSLESRKSLNLFRTRFEVCVHDPIQLQDVAIGCVDIGVAELGDVGDNVELGRS